MGRKSRRKREVAPAPAPVVAPTLNRDRRPLMICGGLVILVAIIFLQLRTHEFLGYDDNIYVTRNDHVKAGLTAAGVRWAFTSMDFNWHPVTWLTHMADVTLFGVSAGPHLLMNALLHAANAILLFVFLLRATRRLWPSAIVAALFAVHPQHVESVAWLSERKDVLSTLFFLIALLLYARWVESRSKSVYVALAVVFALGLMSKGMLVTLPFVLLLLDFWPLRREGIRTLVIEKLPLFALVIPSVIITYKAQKAVSAIAQGLIVPLSIRLANASLSYVAYLERTVWPWPLAIPYPYPTVISPSRSAIAALFVIAVSVAVFLVRNRYRYLFTGWFWFVGTLVPVIGVIQIGVQSMADRYTYIPLIGIFIAIVWLIDEMIAANEPVQMPAAITAAAVIVIFTAVAHAQAAFWRDTETLFRHSLAVTKNNFAAHLGLGSALLDESEGEEAVQELSTAVAINSLSTAAHDNFAAALMSVGRTSEAEAEYRKALAIDPHDQPAQLGLAALALGSGNINDALARYFDLVRRQPQLASAHNDLAAALARAGRDEEALKEYDEALRLDPSQYDAHMNIAALLSRRKREPEAIAHFQAANRLQPQATEPHVYLALVYAQTGRKADAIREAQAAIDIDEKTANTQFTDAVRIAPAPDNLRRFITSLR